jgi:hypothetical protein
MNFFPDEVPFVRWRPAALDKVMQIYRMFETAFSKPSWRIVGFNIVVLACKANVCLAGTLWDRWKWSRILGRLKYIRGDGRIDKDLHIGLNFRFSQVVQTRLGNHLLIVDWKRCWMNVPLKIVARADKS